jgi:hypothetical protein
MAISNLRPGGKAVLLSKLSQQNLSVDSSLIIVKMLTITGYTSLYWFRQVTGQKKYEVVSAVLSLLVQKKIVPPVEAIYPLESFKEAISLSERSGIIFPFLTVVQAHHQADIRPAKILYALRSGLVKVREGDIKLSFVFYISLLLRLPKFNLIAFNVNNMNKFAIFRIFNFVYNSYAFTFKLLCNKSVQLNLSVYCRHADR